MSEVLQHLHDVVEDDVVIVNGKLGQGSKMFGRQAYVGLSDNKYGTVTLGRQYDSLVDYLAQTTANGMLISGVMK